MISGVGSSHAMWSYGVVRDDRMAVRASGGDEEQPADEAQAAAAEPAAEEKPAQKTSLNGKQLTPDEERMVSELQDRDREVRAHESAHKAVGGALAGGMSLSYQTGPDGRQYAVGGEVSIDTGGGGDPLTTMAKMRQVIAAALAPANPSSQDMAVASQAQATLADAQRQLSELQRSKLADGTTSPSDEDPATRSASPVDGYRPQAEEPGNQLDLVA